MAATPLLTISDHPTSNTGLARINRELLQRIHSDLSDTFRVATVGIGGTYSTKLGYPNYTATLANNMVVDNLQRVWKDFAGSQDGIVLTILNPGWLGWLVDPPAFIPESPLRDFLKLENRPFDLWAYVPVDGHNSKAQLLPDCGKWLSQFDRVLAYTDYGATIIENTLSEVKDYRGPKQIEFLPHGLDTSIFYPRDRKMARNTFIERVTGRSGGKPLTDDKVMLGVVATNTLRKDWGLAFQTCKELLDRDVNVYLWGHTDHPTRHWSIPELAIEYGMAERMIITCLNLDDKAMAWAYSAMDCVMGIASGGGWEYPHAEAMGCGVPVVHGNYAGGAEFLPTSNLVPTIGYKVEYNSNVLRPVYDAGIFAKVVSDAIGRETRLPDYIDWNNAWPEWKSWLTKRGR